MNTVKPGQRIAALILTVLALLFCLSITAGAVSLADYEAGTYELDASLSCYVNAMGGVEFGGPLLTGTTLTVEEDGSAFVTLYLTKSSVTIYSVTCDTFVDADPSYVTDDRGVTNGTIGYYDQEGNLITEGVTYTLSDDTALNPSDEEVNYVDSVTFPLTYESDTYALTMYINSNVMGVQFCEENDEAESTTYPAALTIYWDGYAETEEDTEVVEVTGEEMDGLTIYRAEDGEAEEASEDESASESETAIEAASDGDESVAQSAVFGNVSQGLLIALLVIGVLLILLGAASLIANILGTKRKKEEDGGHDA